MNPLEHALTRYCEARRVHGDSPRTVEGYVYTLQRFIAWCGEHGIDAPAQVTTDLLERYWRSVHYWQKPDGQALSLSTQRTRLTQVRVWFRWLLRVKLIALNPAAELELPRVHRRLPKAILTQDEVERLLAHTAVFGEAGLRDRAIMETLYATGIRRSELTQLSVVDVDTGQGTLMVREGKGGKDRLLPIGERACRWIDRYTLEVRPSLLATADERTLFLSDVGKPLRRGWLTERVRHYLEAVGIDKPGSCHLFRHTMATLMLENGADLRYIQAMLGHADISTTTIYAQVSLRGLRDTYARTHPARMARSVERKTDDD